MACRIRENSENNADDGRFSSEDSGDRGAVCLHADGATSTKSDPPGGVGPQIFLNNNKL